MGGGGGNHGTSNEYCHQVRHYFKRRHITQLHSETIYLTHQKNSLLLSSISLLAPRKRLPSSLSLGGRLLSRRRNEVYRRDQSGRWQKKKRELRNLGTSSSTCPVVAEPHTRQVLETDLDSWCALRQGKMSAWPTCAEDLSSSCSPSFSTLTFS